MEHFSLDITGAESMKAKLKRQNLPVTADSALQTIRELIETPNAQRRAIS